MSYDGSNFTARHSLLIPKKWCLAVAISLQHIVYWCPKKWHLTVAVSLHDTVYWYQKNAIWQWQFHCKTKFINTTKRVPFDGSNFTARQSLFIPKKCRLTVAISLQNKVYWYQNKVLFSFVRLRQSIMAAHCNYFGIYCLSSDILATFRCDSNLVCTQLNQETNRDCKKPSHCLWTSSILNGLK